MLCLCEPLALTIFDKAKDFHTLEIDITIQNSKI